MRLSKLSEGVESRNIAGRNALVVRRKGMIKTYINFPEMARESD